MLEGIAVTGDVVGYAGGAGLGLEGVRLGVDSLLGHRTQAYGLTTVGRVARGVRMRGCVDYGNASGLFHEHQQGDANTVGTTVVIP